MTSKISFSKMVGQDMKRRIWVPAMLFLGFFLCLPLAGLFTLETALHELSEGIITSEQVVEQVLSWIGAGNAMTSFLVVVSAVICAFTVFSYLHSRKQLDVYHSIPVKRGKLFLTQYLSGFSLFMIPFLVCEVFSLLICLIRGMLTGEVAAAWGSSLLMYTLYFLVFYHVAIFAVMLTGRMLVSVLGMFVFWGYAPLLMVISQGYMATFFDTYYGMFESNGGFMKILSYLSPITLCFNGQFTDYTGLTGVSLQSWWLKLLLTVLAAMVLFAAALILYKKRRSEAAGHSMAFQRTESPIKVLLLIPLSMGCGMIFRSISYSQSDFWLFFGVLFGLVVFHGVIEVIFHYDIRKIVSRKVSLGIAGAAALLVTVVFRADLFGYNFYLPREDRVESMSISLQELNTRIDYFEPSSEGKEYNYTDNTRYRLKHMKLKEAPEVYEIAKAGIDNLKSKEKMDQINETGTPLTAVIKFTLNGGNEVYRQYTVDLDEVEPQLEGLYANMEFKEAVFPILTMDIEEVRSLRVSDISDYDYALTMSGGEKQKLIETYQSELKQISYAKMKNQPAIGSVWMDLERGFVYGDYLTYPLYPFFSQTIDLMKQHGFEAATEIDPDQVIKVEVGKYESESIYEQELDGLLDIKVYEDKEQIAEILENISWEHDDNLYTDDNWEVNVTMRNRYGEENTHYVSFRKGAVPDFVEEQ